jgi:hypothetical protein
MSMNKTNYQLRGGCHSHFCDFCAFCEKITNSPFREKLICKK